MLQKIRWKLLKDSLVSSNVIDINVIEKIMLKNIFKKKLEYFYEMSISVNTVNIYILQNWFLNGFKNWYLIAKNFKSNFKLKRWVINRRIST